MKNINKKGFTLVELVIVIAAVAILAGLIIFTFANVIKKANDSAAIQNAKNDEIAQKADDIIKKIDESNWFGWEDFETEIVTAVAKAVKENNSNAQLNKDEIKSVVEEAVVTALANIKGDNTELTEDQVKAIVENAMGSLKYEGVTEAQVRAIVNGATATLLGNQLTVAQVRAIVNAANENNLTSVQLANVLASQLGGVVTVTDLNNKMETLQTLLANTGTELASKDDVQDILDAIDDIKNNVESAELDDVVTAKALNIRIKNAGLTKANTPYEVFEAIGFEVVPEKTTILLSIEKDQFGFFVVDDSNKLVNSCGLNIAVVDNTTNIVSDAYKYWVFVGEYIDNLVYSQYLRGTGITGTLNIVTGLDVGKNERISEINYTSDSENTVVIRTNGGTLTVDAENGTVHHYSDLDKLEVDAIAGESYHEHGRVKVSATISDGHLVVEKNGYVNELSIPETAVNASVDIKPQGTVVTAVVDNNVSTVSIDEGATVGQIVAEDTSKISGAGATEAKENAIEKTEVATAGALQEALDNGKKYIVVIADLEQSSIIFVTSDVIIDGQNHTLKAVSASADRSIRITENNVSIQIKNLIIDGNNKSQRAVQLDPDKENVSILLDNVDIKNITYYSVNVCGNCKGTSLNIIDSSIAGWGAINLWSKSYTVYISNSVLIGHNDKSYNADGWNDFGTVILEGDTTGKTTEHSSDIDVKLINTTVRATTSGQGNQQFCILFNEPSAHNNVYANGCKFEYNNSENTYLLHGENETNHFYKDGVLVTTVSE